MKNLFALVMAACLCAATVAIPLAGCKSPTVSQQRQTFNTVWSVAQTVDTSYRTYLDLVITGQLKTNGVPKVSRAYNDFQTTLKLTLAVVVVNTNAQPPAELISRAGNFTTVLTSVKRTDTK